MKFRKWWLVEAYWLCFLVHNVGFRIGYLMYLLLLLSYWPSGPISPAPSSQRYEPSRQPGGYGDGSMWSVTYYDFWWFIGVYSNPKKDRNDNHRQISSDLRFSLFGDDYSTKHEQFSGPNFEPHLHFFFSTATSVTSPCTKMLESKTHKGGKSQQERRISEQIQS